MQFDTIRMGVRIDKEGQPERDYHTALEVIKADGSATDTVVSYRDYLADASFTIGLESNDYEFLSMIAERLRSPEWTLFLGRKAFPLTVPPLRPDDSIKAGTLEEHLLIGQSNRRVVLEKDGGERIQQDWPLCFGQRRFKPRSVTTCFTDQGGME